jgi:TolB-like protein
MVYRFDRFELDPAKLELRADGACRPLEPQVFALLVLLVQNRERVVSRDELIEKVWDGRCVSESAISSRIKSARQALGDDGRAQRFIKTLHSQGFRFVAPVSLARSGALVLSEPGVAGVDEAAADADAARSARPSIAILPFQRTGDPGPHATLAEALPHELIAELSRLRWLFVTARASSFRLRVSEVDVREIGRLLGVRYVLSGNIEVTGARLELTVELMDTRDGGVVWADHRVAPIDDVHLLRAEIRGRILSALEIRIPRHEADLARLTVSEDLDAWSAYHLGLQRMFRFHRRDNVEAIALFERAVALDPGFARAHAGLSFVHFQTAFLRQTQDPSRERDLARRFAERGLELDSLDPFVHFTRGRCFWLEGDLEGSLPWLERATAISPSYAQGIYARAWTESLVERALDGRRHVDLAMSLSPLDPLYYAMLGTRAFTHMALGEDREAADWADRAARSPGAHVLISMIAVAGHALGGDATRAAWWAAQVRARNPTLSRQDFFSAFPMKSEAMRVRISAGLARFGFSL